MRRLSCIKRRFLLFVSCILLVVLLSALIDLLWWRNVEIKEIAMADKSSQDSRCMHLPWFRGGLEELSPLNNVVFAILTSPSFLDTRIPALMTSWVRKVPTAVFVSDHNESLDSRFPLPVIHVALPPGERFGLGVYKDLPGIAGVYDRFPNIEWLFMCDDDTFVIPSNLARLLKPLSHTDPHYIGYFFLNGIFAYGGSGFLLSRATLDVLRGNISDCINSPEYIKRHHAGDIRVGWCIRQSNAAPIEHSWAFGIDVPVNTPLKDLVSFHAKFYDPRSPRSFPSPQQVIRRVEGGLSVATEDGCSYYDFSRLYMQKLHVSASGGSSLVTYRIGVGIDQTIKDPIEPLVIGGSTDDFEPERQNAAVAIKSTVRCFDHRLPNSTTVRMYCTETDLEFAAADYNNSGPSTNSERGRRNEVWASIFECPVKLPYYR